MLEQTNTETALAILEPTTVAPIARYNSINALGQPVNATSWQEAMTQGKLDWTVTKRQHVSPLTGKPVASFGIYRDDNSQFLGQVGNQYTPIQNIDQFQFVDALVNNIEGSQYVNAGAVEGGQKVFASVKLAQFELGASGDVHQAMLTVSDWKNSRGSCHAQICIFRLVCSNGMHAWVPERAMSFKHTPNVSFRMDEVSKSIDLIGKTLETTRTKLDQLATRELTSKKSVEAILDRLFPPTPAELKGRANNTRVETQTKILELLEYNDNGAFPMERNTPFGLLNAVTEYVDHFQTTKATAARSSLNELERRANNALFGRGAEFKARAMDIILEETVSAPKIRRAYDFAPITLN